MTIHPAIDRYIVRRPSVSAGIYLVSVVALALPTLVNLMDIAESYRARDASLERLARMEERGRHSLRQPNSADKSWPPGSPLVEGSTVTMAGASLLQRISSAITQPGGSLVSSELEPLETEAKDGFLRATASFEIEQVALQDVLYDIETGMPFLFVDQLNISAPASGDGGKMRVLVQVSGRWSGGK